MRYSSTLMGMGMRYSLISMVAWSCGEVGEGAGKNKTRGWGGREGREGGERGRRRSGGGTPIRGSSNQQLKSTLMAPVEREEVSEPSMFKNNNKRLKSQIDLNQLRS